MDVKFLFDMKAEVVVVRSGEKGRVIGAAKYMRNSEPCYLLELVASDVCARDVWFFESEIVSA